MFKSIHDSPGELIILGFAKILHTCHQQSWVRCFARLDFNDRPKALVFGPSQRLFLSLLRVFTGSLNLKVGSYYSVLGIFLWSQSVVPPLSSGIPASCGQSVVGMLNRRSSDDQPRHARASNAAAGQRIVGFGVVWVYLHGYNVFQRHSKVVNHVYSGYNHH